MKTVRLRARVPANRELTVHLPDDVPEGAADITVTVEPADEPGLRTLGDLLDSEFFGMWRDREDITDSVAFARRLRDQEWNRSRGLSAG